MIRGAAAFLSSIVTGVKALMYSADFFPEEEAEPSKFDRWVEKRIPAEKLQPLIVGLTVVFSLGMSLALFLLLPTFLAGLADPYIDSALVHNLIGSRARLIWGSGP